MNEQSREVNSIRNFILGALFQVIILALNLVAKTVFIRMLGTAYLGVNGLFTNIFLVLSFAEHGIGPVMLYCLYGPITKSDSSGIRMIYQYFEKIYRWMALGITVIGLAILPLLQWMVNTERELENLKLAFVLFLLGIVITNLFAYKTYIIIADQKKYIVNMYQFIFDFVTMVFQIMVLLVTKDYVLYLLLVLVKGIVFNFGISRKVKKLYPFLYIEEKKKLSIEKSKEILNKINDIVIYRLARVMLTGTDNMIISVIVGTIWVGYYSNYDLVIVGILSLVTTFFSAISASVGNLIAKESVEKQSSIFVITQDIGFWITGFTSTALLVLFQDFITLWLGKELLLDLSIVIVIVINYYLVCNRNTIKVFRNAAGLFQKIKYMMILAAIINIVLSILLGLIWGMLGILIATIIATLTTFYWYEARLLFVNWFGFPFKKFLMDQVKGMLLTMVSISLVLIPTSLISEVTVLTFLLKMIICVVVSNLFYYFFLRKSQAVVLIKKMIINSSNKFLNRRRHV